MNRLILINRDHPIPDHYRDTVDFVELKYPDHTVFLEIETADAFQKLQSAILAAGIRVEADSGYRSPGYQQELWDRILAQMGEDYTKTHVAKPGYSEHHTGLAIDVTLYNSSGEEVFGLYADEYKILFPYLHLFGFILRYPEGKENITGYSFEPWHIRYVGLQAAAVIFENAWTFEEYLSSDSSGSRSV